jgi:hypothetical protein
MTERIESLAREIAAAGLARLEELRGCADADIASIEETFGVVLPAAYRDWLAVMGRGAGQYLLGTDAFYPKVLKLRTWAEELLEENEDPFQLPANAFVFLMHQGYQFMYFETGTGDSDPAVFHYFEGNAAAERKWNRLTDYYWQVLEDHRRLLA